MSEPSQEHSETGEPPEWWIECFGVHSTDAIYIDLPMSIEYRCRDCNRAVIYRKP